MKLQDLLMLDIDTAIKWLIENRNSYELVSLEVDVCSKCGAGDAGVGFKRVYCYNCGHSVNAESQNEAVIKWNSQ